LCACDDEPRPIVDEERIRSSVDERFEATRAAQKDFQTSTSEAIDASSRHIDEAIEEAEDPDLDPFHLND
jgi:hypothetical protein